MYADPIRGREQIFQTGQMNWRALKDLSKGGHMGVVRHANELNESIKRVKMFQSDVTGFMWSLFFYPISHAEGMINSNVNQ